MEAIYSRFVSVLPNDVALNNIGEQFPGLPGGGQQSVRPRSSFAWHWNVTSMITNEVRAGYAKSTPSFINREKFDVGYRLAFDLPITNPIQNFLQQGRAPTTNPTSAPPATTRCSRWATGWRISRPPSEGNA